MAEPQPVAVDSNKKRAQELLARWDKLKQIREPTRLRWVSLADYLLPNRALLMGDFDKRGMLTHNKVFDGTAIHALQLMANGILGYMVSPTYRWFKLKILNRILSKLREVKLWLEESEACLYGEFQHSNFYPAMAQYIMDAGSVGTATVIIQEDLNKGQLVYLVRHPVEICIACDYQGNVDTAFRWFKLSARNAVKLFGKQNLSPEIQRAFDDRPDDEFEFLHALYPREERKITLLTSTNKPIASVYVEVNAVRIVSESGFDTMPAIVWRWDIASGEDYGRCPGTNAIKDVMMLNQIARTNLIAAQKLADPAQNIPLELRGKVDLNPGGRNYIEDPNRVITPTLQQIHLPAGVDREERLQELIKEHFYVDFWLMLQQAERIMTATEIMEKQGEKAAILASITGRFGSEALDRIIQRSFALAYQAGRMPPMPEAFVDWARQSGKMPEYEIEYLGPLAQAQRRMFKSQGIIRGLETMVPIFQLQPDAMDIFDWDKLIKELADSQGMPEVVIRSEKELQVIRDAKARMAQQQMQMQQLDVASSAAAKLAKTAQKGSPLEQMIEAGGQVVPQ